MPAVVTRCVTAEWVHSEIERLAARLEMDRPIAEGMSALGRLDSRKEATLRRIRRLEWLIADPARHTEVDHARTAEAR